jgi:hypothetical protein
MFYVLVENQREKGGLLVALFRGVRGGVTSSHDGICVRATNRPAVIIMKPFMAAQIVSAALECVVFVRVDVCAFTGMILWPICKKMQVRTTLVNVSFL